MAMSALGMTLAHMLRVDLSVAIVSMVNTTSSAAADNESEAVCGGGAAEDSSKDIFGVERRAIAPTLRAHVSHDYQSVTINRLVACTLKCIFLFKRLSGDVTQPVVGKYGLQSATVVNISRTAPRPQRLRGSQI